MIHITARDFRGTDFHDCDERLRHVYVRVFFNSRYRAVTSDCWTSPEPERAHSIAGLLFRFSFLPRDTRCAPQRFQANNYRVHARLVSCALSIRGYKT